MSITFHIAGDRDQSLVERFPCDCQGLRPECGICGGSGTETIRSSAWTLNLACRNARQVLIGLGLEEKDHGRIHAVDLLGRLNQVRSSLLLVAPARTGQMLDCGLGEEQAQRYLENLRRIAVEAARREEVVIWS